MYETLDLGLFCFLILFQHYRKSLSPRFGDDNNDVKTNEIFYFLYHFHTNVYVKLFNIPMNMAIGIRLKIDTSELQQKCFWGDFPQLLELHLLRTHIGGSFQSVRLQKIRKVSGKATMIESFKVKLPEILKNFACLSSVWPKGYIYFSTRISKRSELVWEKCFKNWNSVPKFLVRF